GGLVLRRRRGTPRRSTRSTTEHDLGAGPELGHTVDDHAVARLETAVDDPQVAVLRIRRVDPYAKRDRTDCCDVLAVLVLIDDIDKLSLRAVHHGDLRHRKCVRA